MRNKRFWNWFESEARPKLGARADTFGAMFSYLDTFERPVCIVETGCVRKIGNWAGDGGSTILFDRYIQENGGSVDSVDINPEATALCRKLVKKANVHTGDSVEFLKGFRSSIDLLYLDSFDLTPEFPLLSEVHHINELMAAMPCISQRTLVAVDDSPIRIGEFGAMEVTGKGGLVSRHALEVGAEMLFSAYQSGWVGMCQKEHAPAGTTSNDAEIKDLVDRARRCCEARQEVAAESLYRLILLLTDPPKSGTAQVALGEACAFYARVAIAKQKLGTAVDWYRRALLVDPLAVDYRLELALKGYRGMSMIRLGQQEAAMATRIEPGNPRAWKILGYFETELGNAQRAVECYDKQLALAPDSEDAIFDRMTIALDTADYATVRELATRVMDGERKADALHCLAVAASREGLHEEAIKLFDDTLATPGVFEAPTVHWNKSHSLHSLGMYKEGWAEHDWRKLEKIQPMLALPMVRFSPPVWTRQPPPASIHVHVEAGAGDNLCCCRYLNVLVEMGYDVRYEASEDMVSLMTRSFPKVRVMPKAADYPGSVGLPAFDYHMPIGGLPHVLETDINTVPQNVPYLKSDPELVKKYRAKLPPGRKYIGLCWSSGIRREQGLWLQTYGQMKSMKLADMRPLIERFPDYVFVSLQIGPERAELETTPGVIDILPRNPTWDDTAALVECLDTTITVDTGLSHLVGGMGKPVMLAMHRNGSWHYMAERPGFKWNERSPWYPHTRIFRQQKDYVWSDVIQQIINELKAQKIRLVV